LVSTATPERSTTVGALQTSDRSEVDPEGVDEDQRFLRRKNPVPDQPGGRALRLADLYSGCGGLTLGFQVAARKAGAVLDVRLAVDVDTDARRVYRANFPKASMRRARVENLFPGMVGTPLRNVEQTLADEVGPLHILVGGPPCQGHSDLNNHTRRDDPRNATYVKMARAAEVLRPRVVVIENVPGVTHDVGRAVSLTARVLQDDLGYNLHQSIVDLSDIGVPQRRRRHIMVAAKLDGIRADDVIASLKERYSDSYPRTVRWAIEDLLAIASEAPIDRPSGMSEANRSRVNWLFDHSEHDLPNRLRPKCHQSDHSYKSMYGRLTWDCPAQTITTGFGSMGQGRYIHPAARRTLTPHEAARLQTFPDFFRFDRARTRTALARLIGNAVPPMLAIAVGNRVVPALTKHCVGRSTARS